MIENIQRDEHRPDERALDHISQAGDRHEECSQRRHQVELHPVRILACVGGHCIPVDPYHLVTKARDVGYHAQVILAGRSINDHMPKYVAEMAVRGLNDAGKVISGSKALILGVTYKENVPDTRESPVKDIVKELKEYRVAVYGSDPMVTSEELQRFGVVPTLGDTTQHTRGVGHDIQRKPTGMMNGDPALREASSMARPPNGKASATDGCDKENMSKTRTVLFAISIDTEIDKSPAWTVGPGRTFRSVTEGIPQRFTPLFDEHGARPTYLLSGEVIEDEESVRTLKATKDCELGTHLHGEFVEQQRRSADMVDERTSDMQCAYPRGLRCLKMRKPVGGVHRTLRIVGPCTFRAGRFVAGGNTVRCLERTGLSGGHQRHPHPAVGLSRRTRRLHARWQPALSPKPR